jgi:hypothetical protein
MNAGSEPTAPHYVTPNRKWQESSAQGIAMQMSVTPDATIRCIYSEEMNLRAFGGVSITRASHVEPTADGRWTADLSPVGGPLLGPFHARSEALEAEHRWLEDHWLMAGG